MKKLKKFFFFIVFLLLKEKFNNKKFSINNFYRKYIELFVIFIFRQFFTTDDLPEIHWISIISGFILVLLQKKL